MYLDFQKFKKEYENLDKFKILEDNNFFYLRKPARIPSSFWKQKSVLDYLEKWELDKSFTANQLKEFNKENEYGLLNRLDNDTSWFLYFAKNKDIFYKFKSLQKENKIKKIYYAKINWDFPFKEKIIDYPIMHKNKSKMIVIKSPRDLKKWRWKQHFVKTEVEKILYNKKFNETYLKVTITKWIRHQIRAHLANIWYPIIGDNLYWWETADKLYLFSVGIH